MVEKTLGLFLEDHAHQAFIGALVSRIKGEFPIEARVSVRSVRGGYGKVAVEFDQYLKDLKRHEADYFDAVVVATDANCVGHRARLRELKKIQKKFDVLNVVYAIPDPHIERWFLLDSAAFRRVLGRGCQSPDKKCERGRYKNALRSAVIDSGVTPLLGGIEYAEDLVRELDLLRVAELDRSIGSFIQDLRALFTRMSQT